MINGGHQVGVLQPGANHVPAGKHITVTVHQKCSALRHIAIHFFIIDIQPVLHQYKCDRRGILIGIIFQAVFKALFTLAEMIPGQNTGNG